MKNKMEDIDREEIEEETYDYENYDDYRTLDDFNPESFEPFDEETERERVKEKKREARKKEADEIESKFKDAKEDFKKGPTVKETIETVKRIENPRLREKVINHFLKRKGEDIWDEIDMVELKEILKNTIIEDSEETETQLNWEETSFNTNEETIDTITKMNIALYPTGTNINAIDPGMMEFIERNIEADVDYFGDAVGYRYRGVKIFKKNGLEFEVIYNPMFDDFIGKIKEIESGSYTQEKETPLRVNWRKKVDILNEALDFFIDGENKEVYSYLNRNVKETTDRLGDTIGFGFRGVDIIRKNDEGNFYTSNPEVISDLKEEIEEIQSRTAKSIFIQELQTTDKSIVENVALDYIRQERDDILKKIDDLLGNYDVIEKKEGEDLEREERYRQRERENATSELIEIIEDLNGNKKNRENIIENRKFKFKLETFKKTIGNLVKKIFSIIKKHPRLIGGTLTSMITGAISITVGILTTRNTIKNVTEGSRKLVSEGVEKLGKRVEKILNESVRKINEQLDRSGKDLGRVQRETIEEESNKFRNQFSNESDKLRDQFSSESDKFRNQLSKENNRILSKLSSENSKLIEKGTLVAAASIGSITLLFLINELRR